MCKCEAESELRVVAHCHNEYMTLQEVAYSKEDHTVGAAFCRPYDFAPTDT